MKSILLNVIVIGGLTVSTGCVTTQSGAHVVVLVPFPFSDLSRSKLRSAIVLASAIGIKREDFELGGLRVDSYARPGKLFASHESLLRAEADRC